MSNESVFVKKTLRSYFNPYPPNPLSPQAEKGGERRERTPFLSLSPLACKRSGEI